MLAYSETMPALIINGITIEAADVPLKEARDAVYIVRHIESGRVYVGMTRLDVGNRWRQHCYDVSRVSKRRHHFNAALAKYGAESFDVFVLEHAIAPDLLPAREKHFVSLLCSNISAQGFNSTSGGESDYVYTAEVKQKISALAKGRVISPDHRKKLSAAITGMVRSSETCAKIGDIHRGKKATAELRQKMRDAHLGKKPTDATKEKMSASQRARYMNLEVKEGNAKQMRDLHADPEFQIKRVAALRAVLTSDVHKAKLIELARTREYSAETRAKLRAAANKRWNKSREN